MNCNLGIFILSVLALAGVGQRSAAQADAGNDANTRRFAENFHARLAPEWHWEREHPEAWRLTSKGLEIRIEPGNMWGSQNDARNVLIHPAPNPAEGRIEISVLVENTPTNQYEQVDLTWFYDDSNMVKIGEELVDGKLSIVMGREEKDRTRTITIVPIDFTTVHLKLVVSGNQIEGFFRSSAENQWRKAGQCDLPVHDSKPGQISLQCYQGRADVEHWARITDFQIKTGNP